MVRKTPNITPGGKARQSRDLMTGETVDYRNHLANDATKAVDQCGRPKSNDRKKGNLEVSNPKNRGS